MAMQSIYRVPQTEEGKHNVILQNRCGNRLTVLFHDDGVELELTYKPNAYRRRDFRARNFSNRDNYTKLFADARLPEVQAGFVQQFSYDPFLTVVRTEAPSRASNVICFLNVADENVFGVTAHCPLVLCLRPHDRFAAEDGLLWERFTDRGEEIVSFVAFDGFEANRYRVLEDGRHVVQIMANEVVLLGGEESPYQMRRVLGLLGCMSREELIERTEEVIDPVVSRSRLAVREEPLQQVVDINRRVICSGLDEGGACFGALNRIYHLIWFRDGALTASQMALAGNPEIARIWAPFAVQNPSDYKEHGGTTCPEYLQLVGTPWTKREDDGLFYAVLSAYSAYQATGSDRFARSAFLRPLVDAVNYHVATRWNKELGMFGSDTMGETTLVSSERFGYDSVNGRMQTDEFHVVGEREVARTHSLYHNVNNYNVLRMMEALLAESPEVEADTGQSYRKRADELERSIADAFRAEDGAYRAAHVVFSDGSSEWLGFEDGDQWEYAWAVSVGPFFPCLATALRSARVVREKWPGLRHYGYCPWNCVAGLLLECGMSGGELREMLAAEVEEALAVTEKYPMHGALTERYGVPNSWRALPFSAATFINTLTSCAIRGLPMGLAVRAIGLVDEVTDYTWRNCVIHAALQGDGDAVESVTVNGVGLRNTLQLPEATLRTGRNEVVVVRGAGERGPRLFGSDARLLGVRTGRKAVVYRMHSPTRADLVFEGLPAGARVDAQDASGQNLETVLQALDGTDRTVVTVRPAGDFTVRLPL
jgi:hypothetical protein